MYDMYMRILIYICEYIHTYICIYIDIFFVNFRHFARSVEFIDEAVKRGLNQNFNLIKLFASLLTLPINKLECWSFAFFSGLGAYVVKLLTSVIDYFS